MTGTTKHICSFDQLQSYVDGSLSEQQAREIGAHLDSCAECRAVTDKLRSLDALTAQAAECAAPDRYFDTFGSRVASRIAARKVAPAAPVAPAALERRRFRWPLWGVVPLAAAAGLVLLIALRPEAPAPQLVVQLPPAKRIESIAPSAEPAANSGKTISEPAVPGKPYTAAESAAPAAPVATAASGAPATIAAADEQPVRPDELKAESSASDKPSIAATRAAPMVAARAKKMSETPANALAYSTASPESKESRMPDRAKSAKDQQAPATAAAPSAPITQAAPVTPVASAVPVRVIVIHLPDGRTYCPAPEIATAIEIILPPGVSAN